MKTPVLASLTLAVMLMFCAGAMAQRVTVTVAGNGINSYSGDNGPAKSASLSLPNDVCIDGARNLYFSDQTGTRIRKLTASTGIIKTIAGGGTTLADGVDATLTSMTLTFMAVDAAGNVYYTQGSMVRRIDAITNLVTTIAGVGMSSADGVPAMTAAFPALRGITVDHLGNIFVLAGNMVKKIEASTGLVYTIAGSPTLTGATGDGGPAAAALLWLPKYITCDHSGNLYFGDQNAGVAFSEIIRRIDATTGIITKVIGGGSTLFSCSGYSCMVGGMSGLCCDNNDDVIFNEWSCSCRKWDHETDWVTNVAGNFYIESFKNDTTSDFAYMNNNFGICSDADNNYYIADKMNHRIRKVMLLTHAPVFAFGDAQTTKACTMAPVVIDSMLWVADMDAGDVETWSLMTPPISGGTVTGLSTTATSNGLTKTTKPTGVYYTPAVGFSGTDMFEVKISDGTYSDVMQVFVRVGGVPNVTGPDDVCVTVPVLMSCTMPGGTWSTATPGVSVTAGGVLIGSVPGPATVLYTVHNGCALVTGTKDVNIAPVPDAGVISGSAVLCPGADIVLTTTGTGGVWTASNSNASVTGGVVHGLTGGSVTINYTVTNVCGTSTASQPVTVIPAPDPGVITGADEVCTKSTITLAATGLAGGTWTADNTNATVTGAGTIYGEHAGTVTIRYQVMNECGMGEATKLLAVNDCVPSVLPNLAVTTAVNVYPTPAANTLNIKVSALPVSTASISLMDVTGRVVASDVIANNTTKGIDVTQLANGVYTLAISGDNYSYVNKVVVSK